MFSDPSLDLGISLTLLGISVLVAFVFWALTKKKSLALLVFSLLGNLSFLISIESRMFHIYNIAWLQYGALFIWPILNIYLLINYFSKKNEQK